MFFDLARHHNLNFLNKNLKSSLSKTVDKFALPLALYGSLATAPQVYEVVIMHQTAGISILTFSLFLVGNVFWFCYGQIHNDLPIMASHLTTGLLNAIIIGGVLF